jgi:hypothetical protein
MNNLTKRSLAPLIGLTLLVSGCSTSDPDYDQLEVILWEKCISDYLDRYSQVWQAPDDMVAKAKKACVFLKPVKK